MRQLTMSAETSTSNQFLPNPEENAFQGNAIASNTLDSFESVSKTGAFTRPAKTPTFALGAAHGSKTPTANTEHSRLMEIILENMMKPPTKKSKAQVEEKAQLVCGSTPTDLGKQLSPPFPIQDLRPTNYGAPDPGQSQQRIVSQGFGNASWHFEQEGADDVTLTGVLGPVPHQSQHYRAPIQNGPNDHQFYSAGRGPPVISHPPNDRNVSSNSCQAASPFDMYRIQAPFNPSQFPNYSPWPFYQNHPAAFYHHFPHPNFNFNNGLHQYQSHPNLELHSFGVQNKTQLFEHENAKTSNPSQVGNFTNQELVNHFQQMPLRMTSTPRCSSSNETVLQDSPLLIQQNDAERNLNPSFDFESSDNRSAKTSFEGPAKKTRKMKSDSNGDIVQEGEQIFWGVRLLAEDAQMLAQINLELIADGVIIKKFEISIYFLPYLIWNHLRGRPKTTSRNVTKVLNLDLGIICAKTFRDEPLITITLLVFLFYRSQCCNYLKSNLK